MEFLPHDKALALLARHSVAEVAHADRHTLEITPADHAALVTFGNSMSSRSRAPVIESRTSSPDALGAVAETVLHRLHVDEVLVFPSGVWRDVLDIAAFDLARDPSWLEIDAEATMHQNSRDPLLVPPAARHLVRTLIHSVMTSGSSPDQDVVLAAVTAPLVIQVHAAQSITVWCPSVGVARTLLSKLD